MDEEAYFDGLDPYGVDPGFGAYDDTYGDSTYFDSAYEDPLYDDSPYGGAAYEDGGYDGVHYGNTGYDDADDEYDYGYDYDEPDEESAYAAYGREPYGEDLRESILEEIGGSLEQVLAPLIHQQALLALGDPSRVSQYTEGLSPQEVAFIATHPGLSRAIREAQDAPYQGHRQAPRSESGYMPDSGYLSAADQRELRVAQQTWADQPWFDAKAFRDMTLGRWE